MALPRPREVGPALARNRALIRLGTGFEVLVIPRPAKQSGSTWGTRRIFRFLSHLIRELEQRGYTVVLTDAFQLCELADKFGLPYKKKPSLRQETPPQGVGPRPGAACNC
jgi:hypothetical protein